MRTMLFGILLLAAAVASAQGRAQLVFHAKDGMKSLTIKRGDFVKIRMDDLLDGARYVGTFRTAENGMVYLKGRPAGIPIDHIESLRYRPLAARWLFWCALLVGAILVDIGFLSVFVVASKLPQTLLLLGLAMMGISVIQHQTALRRINRVQTDWVWEIHTPPPPVQPMSPIP